MLNVVDSLSLVSFLGVFILELGIASATLFNQRHGEEKKEESFFFFMLYLKLTTIFYSKNQFTFFLYSFI